MEHTEAIETNASDRYVLGQLSAAEVDAFEEHYFDCAACADDVRLGMSIMEGGRRLVREASEPVAPPTPMAPVVPIDSRHRFAKWIPAAAAAALLTIPAHFVMLTRMQNAVPVASFGAVPGAVDLDTMRSQQAPIVVSPNSAFTFTVPADITRFSKYEARLVDAEGKVVSEGIFTEEEGATGRSLHIFDARPGEYQLLIFGTDPIGQSRRIVRRDVIVKPR